MKKFILILACLFLVCGCDYFNKSNGNITDNQEKETKEEKKVEDVLDETTNFGKLNGQLLEYSRELYNKNEYLNYKKVDGMYFISLKELNEKYGYDISIYKNEKGDVCDVNQSGIAFDIDGLIIKDESNKFPTLVRLIGCDD